jgi:hypothetical protein
MAKTDLQIGIDVCQTNSCKAINMTDSTGQQSLTNTTGWGDGYSPNPNMLTTDVDKTVLQVTPPSGTVYTFNTASPGAKNALLLAAFPSIPGTTQFPLFAQDLGYTAGEALPDGIYTFNLTANCTYIVGGQPNDVQETAYLRVFLTCAATCCVDKLFHKASAETNCNSCKLEKLNTALEAQAYLTDAQYAAACGKYNQALELLAKVQWICNTKNCNNC